MGTFIAVVIMIVILIVLINKLRKKTRELRASFRDSFGGGLDKTIENAVTIIRGNAKGNSIPSWAMDEAVKELVKYNAVENAAEGQAMLREHFSNQGFRVVHLTKGMKIEQGMDKKAVETALKERLPKLDAGYYKRKLHLSEKDQKLVKEWEAAYYFAIDECTIDEAIKTVGEIIEQWQDNVINGRVA